MNSMNPTLRRGRGIPQLTKLLSAGALIRDERRPPGNLAAKGDA